MLRYYTQRDLRELGGSSAVHCPFWKEMLIWLKASLIAASSFCFASSSAGPSLRWKLANSQNYSAGGFLNHVVTFHDFFATFATPTMLPLTDFLMKWGNLLIGLSLVSGSMVRISGPSASCHGHLPLRADGLAVHRRSSESLRRLPPRLRDRNCLPDAHHAGHVRGLDGLVTNWPWSSVILACDRCSAEFANLGRNAREPFSKSTARCAGSY